MTAWTPIASTDQINHLPSGLLASGEANYADFLQVMPSADYRYVQQPSLIQPSGLYFQSHISSGIYSLQSGIYDFSIFNPYVHYYQKQASPLYITPSSLLVAASSYFPYGR